MKPTLPLVSRFSWHLYYLWLPLVSTTSKVETWSSENSIAAISLLTPQNNVECSRPPSLQNVGPPAHINLFTHKQTRTASFRLWTLHNIECSHHLYPILEPKLYAQFLPLYKVCKQNTIWMFWTPNSENSQHCDFLKISHKSSEKYLFHSPQILSARLGIWLWDKNLS